MKLSIKSNDAKVFVLCYVNIILKGEDSQIHKFCANFGILLLGMT